MKNVLFVVLLLGSFSGAVFQALNLSLPEAKVTLQVIDEQGVPVCDAQVTMAFEYNKGAGVRSHEVKGLTDGKGCYSGSGKTSGYVAYVVEKQGYYRTVGTPYRASAIKEGRWQPFDPTCEAVLKKIGNPIPMYARQALETNIPKSGRPVGFDLIEGDWVAPFGKGKQADLLFRLQARVASWRDYDSKLDITFSNKRDGMIAATAHPKYGSELRLRTAPEEGYLPELVSTRGRTPGVAGAADQMIDTSREDQNYFIRVRTVVDDEGKLASALFGKIYGDFNFDPRNSEGAAFLRFTYYLNPTANDRNLEFDPSRNLSTGLKSTEEVTLP